ncbi:MAG: hypothetical protein HYS43_00945 [Candidatus Liptonbacteria bacterium]|nr:hypothetical protein [Candidatus Liptonbacteria bacterium]
MVELLKLIWLLVGVTAEEAQAALAQIRNHPRYVSIRNWAIVSGVGIVTGPPAFLIWAAAKNVPALILVAGVWAALWSFVFWVFASPIGLLIEALIVGKLSFREAGKTYARHLAYILFWELVAALVVFLLPVGRAPEFIVPILVAVLILSLSSALGVKNIIDAKKWAARLAFFVVAVGVFAMLFPATFSTLRDQWRGMDAVMNASITKESTVTVAAPVSERMRCAEAPALQNGAYRPNQSGCYAVTIPQNGTTPVFVAGDYYYAVCSYERNVNVTFGDGKIASLSGKQYNVPGSRSNTFRVAGEPGTRVEIRLSTRPVPCML